MKKIKEIVSLALVLGMMSSVVACSDSNKNIKETSKETEVIETKDVAETTKTFETTIQENTKTEQDYIDQIAEFKQFCQENFDEDLCYFDDEIDGLLNIYYNPDFDELGIKYFLSSQPFSDGLDIIFCNQENVVLNIYTDYKNHEFFSLTSDYYPISDIENIVFNINNGDYVLSNNKTIESSSWNYSYGECDEEQAKDVQIMYARLVTMANHLLADYGSTKTISDFGLPVTDRLDSISVTEMPECDNRFGMPKFSSDSSEWFDSFKDAITFLSYDPREAEPECELPLTPESIGLDSNIYATYMPETDTIRLYFRTIKDESFIDKAISIFLKNGSDEVLVNFDVQNATIMPREDGEPESGSPSYAITDSIVSFTCDKSELLSILKSSEKIMEIGNFNCGYISEEETVEALVEFSKIAIPSFECDLNYLGTSLTDAGIE